MTVCCRYNSKGRCKSCSCVRVGRSCTGCLPSRKGHCDNRSAPVDSTATLDSLDVPRASTSPELTTSCVCGICGESESFRPMIQCCGPKQEWFHCECANIQPPPPNYEWWCLHCLIQCLQHSRVLRHIPKGARIQWQSPMSWVCICTTRASQPPNNHSCISHTRRGISFEAALLVENSYSLFIS